jgi:hypothetical protein
VAPSASKVAVVTVASLQVSASRMLAPSFAAVRTSHCSMSHPMWLVGLQSLTVGDGRAIALIADVLSKRTWSMRSHMLLDEFERVDPASIIAGVADAKDSSAERSSEGTWKRVMEI